MLHATPQATKHLRQQTYATVSARLCRQRCHTRTHTSVRQSTKEEKIKLKKPKKKKKQTATKRSLLLADAALVDAAVGRRKICNVSLQQILPAKYCIYLYVHM